MWSGGSSSTWTSGLSIELVLWSTLVIVVIVCFLTVSAFTMRIRNALRARRFNAHEAVWEPILLEVIGEAMPLARLHETVTPRSARHFLRFLTRYARLLSGSDRRVIVEAAEPVLPLILGDLRARRPSKRALAVQTLATLGIEQHGPTIAEALDDRSRLVSMVAARTLSGSRRPEYIDAVLLNLGRYSNWNSRFLASMLASMGAEVAPALRAYLAAPGDPVDRAVAADALSLLTDPAAAEIAATVLSSIPDKELAAASLRLLKSVGGPEHLSIARSYTNSRDFVLRALAIRVLGTIGDSSDFRRLEDGLYDENPWVAINSAEAMLDAGGTDRLRAIAGSGHPQAALAREVMMKEVA